MASDIYTENLIRPSASVSTTTLRWMALALLSFALGYVLSEAQAGLNQPSPTSLMGMAPGSIADWHGNVRRSNFAVEPSIEN